ncbi:unnamed protein product [Caenorhabditis brenneri]
MSTSSTTILFLLFATLVSTSSDQLWLTTVITEFKVRDQCADFWSQSQACPAPLLRISTDINTPTQFASRAWPLSDIVNSTRPSFVSQWHGAIETVRVTAQIEGSNPLNPFGLVAKCDEGFHPKVIFNQSSANIMERLSTRVILINSQCFNAKVLLKVDNECPYCPPPTTTTPMTTIAPESFIYTHKVSISLCVLLVVIFIISIVCFIYTLMKVVESRRNNGFKQFPSASLESGISTIAPLANSTMIVEEKKPEVVDFFSLMPPVLNYEEMDFDVTVDVKAMPPLGNVAYDYFSQESNLNVSVSAPVFV